MYNFGGVPDQGYFAVFDGHGGRSAAKWCGERLHGILEANLAEGRAGRPLVEVLDETFCQADAHLTGANGIYSGTTAIVALLRWEPPPPQLADGDAAAGSGRRRVLYTANVGDARAVLVRDGRPVRLSYDHKGSDACEQERVRSAGGIIVNDRVGGILAVTRALGDAEMKEFVSGRPYTCRTVLDDGAPRDTHLILACDGLWDVCTDQEACALIADVGDAQLAAHVLLEHALQAGSCDNISVLAVCLRPPAGDTTN